MRSANAGWLLVLCKTIFSPSTYSLKSSPAMARSSSVYIFFWFLTHDICGFHCTSIGTTTAYLLKTSIATNLAPSCTMIMRCNNRILSRCFPLSSAFFLQICSTSSVVLLLSFFHASCTVVFFCRIQLYINSINMFLIFFVCVEFI